MKSHRGLIYILSSQGSSESANHVDDPREQRLEFRCYFAVLNQTSNTLVLFEGQAEWEAGNAALWSVSLPMVIAIEPVSYAANGYPWSQWKCNFIWQMVVQDSAGNDLMACTRRRAYYCSVQSKEDYQAWLSVLKSASSRNCSWLTRHHPGIFLATADGEPASCWTCCQQDHEAQSGCTLTNIVGLESEGVLHRNQAKLDPVSVYRGFKVTVSKTNSVSHFSSKAATFKDGDTFYVLDTSPSTSAGNLWLIIQEENSDIRRLLPREMFEVCDIRRESWFYQEIPHDIASMLLQTQPAGSFLIRSYKQRLMVSYVSSDVIQHRWIHQNESYCYYLEEDRSFNTVQELVQHYSALNRHNKNPLFRFYVPQQNLEKLWAIERSELEANQDVNAQLVSLLGTGCLFDTTSCHFTEKRVACLMLTAVNDSPGAGAPNLNASAGSISKSSSQRSADSLWNEARILMCLQHDNLCKLIGVMLPPQHSMGVAALSARVSAVVIEHHSTPRENLCEFVKKEKETLLAESNTLFDITYQICTGMAYLQRKGIVHNALALENCYLANSARLRVRISGFHHAQFEDQLTDAQPDLHQSYASILALPPPELVHHRALPSSRSDVWSFGVLLWKLFSFGGGATSAMNVSVSKILRHNWNSELPPDVARFIEKVIRMCLVEVPDLRVTFQDLWRIFRDALSLTDGEVNSTQQQTNNEVVTPQSTSNMYNSVTSTDSVNGKRKKPRGRLHLGVSFDPSLETAPKFRSPFTPALPLLENHVVGTEHESTEDSCLATAEDETWHDCGDATVVSKLEQTSTVTDSEACSGTELSLSASSSEPRSVASANKTLRFQLMKEKHEKRKVWIELKQCKAKCIEYIEQLREQYQTKIEALETQLAESETVRRQLAKEKGALQRVVDDKIRVAESKNSEAYAMVDDMQSQMHQLATSNGELVQVCEALKNENRSLADRSSRSDRSAAEAESRLEEAQRVIEILEQKVDYYEKKHGSMSIGEERLFIKMPSCSTAESQLTQSSSSGSSGSGSSVIRGSMTSDSGISTNSSIGLPKRAITMSYGPSTGAGTAASSSSNSKTAIVKMQQHQQQQATSQTVPQARLGFRQSHNVRQAQAATFAIAGPHSQTVSGMLSISHQSLASVAAASSNTNTNANLNSASAVTPGRIQRSVGAEQHRFMQEVVGATQQQQQQQQQFGQTYSCAAVAKGSSFNSPPGTITSSNSGSNNVSSSFCSNLQSPRDAASVPVLPATFATEDYASAPVPVPVQALANVTFALV